MIPGPMPAGRKYEIASCVPVVLASETPYIDDGGYLRFSDEDNIPATISLSEGAASVGDRGL